MVIKLAVIHRNGLFSNDELKLAERFKNKFHTAGMAIVSFYEVDYSYDQNYLLSALKESHMCLNSIVSKHLTDKSIARIDSVFNFFANAQFLDAIFKPDSEYRDVMGRIVADLNESIERGDL